MKIFDEKFLNNKLRYILQCSLAMFSVFILLLFFDVVSHSVTIAALGSSTFIVFTMPKAKTSRPRYLIGGYIVSIAMGLLCYYLPFLPLLDSIFIVHGSSHVIFGALSVGLAIFGMVITNTEHPPAAGLALALILDEWSCVMLVATFTGIVSLSVIKYLFRSILKNLL